MIKCAFAILLPLALSSCGNLFGTSRDDNIYVGGEPIPKGPVSIGRHYSFRFAEKWRISHAWIQGTRIMPCIYVLNTFKEVAAYPDLAKESNGPMFEHQGKIYFASTRYKSSSDAIHYYNLDYHVIGHIPDGFERSGYKPFCSQPIPDSPHGMGLWILKPNSAFGTDTWIQGAVPTQVNGLTWLVRKVPPVDMGPGVEQLKTIEFWTLPIPDTPYWLHMRFNANLRSLLEFPAEHVRMQKIFYDLVASVKLEPIAPAPAPPFIVWTPPPLKTKP